MGKPAPRRYSAEEIVQYREKVLLNATQLVEESELLARHGRYPRAFALAQLASEELAKLPMLARAQTEVARGIEFDWALLGRRMKDHHRKNMNLELLEFFMIEEPNVPKDPVVLARTFNDLKNLSLYAGEGWAPCDVLPQGLAEEMVTLARNRLNFFSEAEAVHRDYADALADGRYEEACRHVLGDAPEEGESVGDFVRRLFCKGNATIP